MSALRGWPWAAIAVFVVTFTMYAINQPSALSSFGIASVLNNAIPLTIAACGLTLVIITGGFDLSALGVVALTNCLVATQIPDGVSGALLGVAMVVATGLVVGVFNGFLVAVAGAQSIAATLGSMIICSGLALLVLPSPGGSVADSIAYGLTGSVYGIPVTVLMILALLAFWGYLRRTRFGFGIYATGADSDAAHNAGVNVRRTLFFTYTLAGVSYGLAGYMLSAQTASGDPNLSPNFLLLAFASVAIGGTRFGGGRGGVVGSVFGALTLTVLSKMLFVIGVSSFLTGFFEGLVMLIAAVAGSWAIVRQSARQSLVAMGRKQ